MTELRPIIIIHGSAGQPNFVDVRATCSPTRKSGSAIAAHREVTIAAAGGRSDSRAAVPLGSPKPPLRRAGAVWPKPRWRRTSLVGSDWTRLGSPAPSLSQGSRPRRTGAYGEAPGLPRPVAPGPTELTPRQTGLRLPRAVPCVGWKPRCPLGKAAGPLPSLREAGAVRAGTPGPAPRGSDWGASGSPASTLAGEPEGPNPVPAGDLAAVAWPIPSRGLRRPEVRSDEGLLGLLTTAPGAGAGPASIVRTFAASCH